MSDTTGRAVLSFQTSGTIGLVWAEMQAQVVQTVSTVSMEQVPSKLAVGRQFANDPGNVVVANRVRGLLREAPRNQEGHELYDEIDDDLRTGS